MEDGLVCKMCALNGGCFVMHDVCIEWMMICYAGCVHFMEDVFICMMCALNGGLFVMQDVCILCKNGLLFRLIVY